jgi:hypothetical protein
MHPRRAGPPGAFCLDNVSQRSALKHEVPWHSIHPLPDEQILADGDVVWWIGTADRGLEESAWAGVCRLPAHLQPVWGGADWPRGNKRLMSTS